MQIGMSSEVDGEDNDGTILSTILSLLVNLCIVLFYSSKHKVRRWDLVDFSYNFRVPRVRFLLILVSDLDFYFRAGIRS